MNGYRRIYVPVDGSELSNAAAHLAVLIAQQDHAEVIGSHVYAARLHDQRFRAMESGLPERYQKEPELEKQRTVHDSLIGKGLRLISDSYLDVLRALCHTRSIPFATVSLEGKNWQQLAKDIEAHDYDLVALGGHGLGRVPEARLGTVALRLLRRVRGDVLICKVPSAAAQSDTIAVCLDGSARSWGSLQRGLHLARLFQKKLVALAAFDPFFHHAMFSTLNEVLSAEARKVFRFEEQKKLHESIINAGLARIYQSHLELAKRLCQAEDVELETHLLTGKVYSEVSRYAREQPLWLLVLGRLGIHSAEDMDIGGNTENICQQVDCNLLVTDLKSDVLAEYQADKTVTWTQEARTRMEELPSGVRDLAAKAASEFALARGHTVISSSVLKAAVDNVLPACCAAKVTIISDGVSEPRPTVAASSAEPMETADFSAFECQLCGFMVEGARPDRCPSCRIGELMKMTAAARRGASAAATKDLQWEPAALERLQRIPVGFMRTMTRCRIEHLARQSAQDKVTLELVEAKYQSWKAGSRDLTMKLPWSPDALQRVERVPEFIRAKVIQEIESHASEAGKNHVDSAVLDGVVKKWGDFRLFHVPRSAG